MKNEIFKVVNDPLDFIIWLLYNKKKKLGITRLMKSFQLFTLFEKFQNLSKFNAEQFGARDSHLDALIFKYDDILFTINESTIIKNNRKSNFCGISLINLYREKLNEKLKMFISDIENKNDFNLIKAIAFLSDKYSFKEFLRFAYTISPELTVNSIIKSEILSIPDEIVRRQILDFIEQLPHSYALEFLIMKFDIIINFSLIKMEFKRHLKNILYNLLISEKLSSLFKAIQEDLLKIIDQTEDVNYNIILRNFLDILIENEACILTPNEKIHLFKYLVLIHNPAKDDIKNYYEFWNQSMLKVIFGKEIEN